MRQRLGDMAEQATTDFFGDRATEETYREVDEAVDVNGEALEDAVQMTLDTVVGLIREGKKNLSDHQEEEE